MPNKNTPDIRFPGFFGDWEQRKFQDFTKLSQGLQIAIDKRHLVPGENRLFYITNEFLNPNSDKKYYIESPPKSVVAGKEDILMTRTGNTGKVVTNVEGAFHNNFFKIAYNNKEISKLFLYYLLNLFSVQKEILAKAGTSTIPDLNHSDFYKIKVNTPLVEEQTKIGNFFKHLDETIALHQQELTTLKQTKQGFLQKMFPKEGESVPEVRFPGFTEVWKECDLGNAVEFYSGLTYSPDNITEKGTLVLRSSNIQNGEIVDADNVYVNPKFVNSQNIEVGDVIVVVRNGSRNLIGKHASVKKKVENTVIGAFMTGIRAEIPSFINVLLDSNQFSIEINKNLGATINQITTGNFKKMKFFFPENDEQEKIGNFFEQLDETIALQQQELDILQETKRAFLQKMFV